jgi:hypothetical protein
MGFTDDFTSPPKEVVLRIFITLKNPSTSVGIEPVNFGSSGEHANHLSTEGDFNTTVRTSNFAI